MLFRDLWKKRIGKNNSNVEGEKLVRCVMVTQHVFHGHSGFVDETVLGFSELLKAF
jgi:hypothetical protein